MFAQQLPARHRNDVGIAEIAIRERPNEKHKRKLPFPRREEGMIAMMMRDDDFPQLFFSPRNFFGQKSKGEKSREIGARKGERVRWRFKGREMPAGVLGGRSRGRLARQGRSIHSRVPQRDRATRRLPLAGSTSSATALRACNPSINS